MKELKELITQCGDAQLEELEEHIDDILKKRGLK